MLVVIHPSAECRGGVVDDAGQPKRKRLAVATKSTDYGEWHVWNTIWAIGAAVSARAVREEAAFLLDELLKAQNLAQAVSAKQREGRM